MRRPWFLLAIALVLLIAAGCDFPHIAPPGTAPVRYRDDLFATVDKTVNITYGSAQNLSHQTVTLTMDMYVPHGDTVTSRPAIVWVHGGSFSGGDKSSGELVDESNVFAKKGYVNVSINYRLEPGGCSAGGGATATCIGAIQEATQDAQTAVKFLRANAATYGIDATRIAIGGSSAGAITALEVGYSTAENPAAGVRAAMSLSGANLLTTANKGDAPALLFHGTADTTVPYAWAVGTRDRAQAAGLDVFLTSYQGDGHVPYAQHRADILDQTRNFLWWEMSAGAAT
jgi:predicted esterase